MVRRLPRQREAEVPEPLVSGWDTQTVVLIGIFGFLLLWMLYFARDILVPITFAFVLNLLLQPAARSLARFNIPKPIAALLTLLVFLSLLLLLGVTVVGPLSAWVAKAPESLPRLESDLWALRAPAAQTDEGNRSSARGNAGGCEQVQVSEQQRTRIHERIGRLRTQRLNRADFSLEVGASVPRSVRVYTLPPEIVEVVPEYRGYDYVLVGDDIVIIDPESHEIVAVIPA